MLRQLKKARDSLGVIGGGGGDPFEEGKYIDLNSSGTLDATIRTDHANIFPIVQKPLKSHHVL